MTATRLLLTLMLLPCVARPSEAQRLAPVAVRALDVAPLNVAEQPGATFSAASPADTLPEPRRAISPVGTIIGGVAGGVVGAFVGLALGARSAEGCHGEECGLLNAILGFALGESLGVGVGAHLGSRSTRHENVILTTLTSTAILVGGTFLGAAMQQAGAVMVPLTPAMQLTAAWAIESSVR